MSEYVTTTGPTVARVPGNFTSPQIFAKQVNPITGEVMNARLCVNALPLTVEGNIFQVVDKSEADACAAQLAVLDPLKRAYYTAVAPDGWLELLEKPEPGTADFYMIYASNGPGQAPTLIGYAANFIAAQQQGPAEAHWTAEYPEPFAAIDTILFNWVA